MASNSYKETAFRHYQNRRKGIFNALTKDFETNLKKCKAIMPGTPYYERFVLVGLEDGSYQIRHPRVGEGHLPPCLPLFHGQVTRKIWLKVALEASNAWLAGTLMSDFDISKMSQEDRKNVLHQVFSIPDLQKDVLCFHENRSQTDAVDDVDEVSPSASNVLVTVKTNLACSLMILSGFSALYVGSGIIVSAWE